MSTTKRPPHSRKRTPALEELSPRILYSADLLPQDQCASDTANQCIVDNTPAEPDNQPEILSAGDCPTLSESHPLMTQSVVLLDGLFNPVQDTTTSIDATSTEGQRLELIFVDGSLENVDALVQELQATDDPDTDTIVIELDPQQNGMQQILGRIQGISGIDAIHLVTHGTAGTLNLGNLWLNETNLSAYENPFREIGKSLSADADFMIYGCDIASNDSGKRMVETLSSWTGADIAASTNLTGNIPELSDWTLEYNTGEIESRTRAPFDSGSGWQGLLTAINVTTTADVVDGTTTSIANLLTNKGADGLISLREAIIAANNTAGIDTINLASGTYTFALSGAEEFAATGDLDIRESLNIIGTGMSSCVIDANLLDRAFDVISGTLSLQDLQIFDGKVDNSDGGALLVEAGASAILNRVDLYSNETQSAGNGGAIENLGTLVVSDSQIRSNLAIHDGGAIRNSGGNVTLDRVSLTANSSTTTNAGAILNQGGTLAMTNVTVSGNSAVFDGGGIRVSAGTVTISYSTIVNNTSSNGNGGGISVNGGTLNLVGTIVANNVAFWGTNDISGTVVSQGYNLIEDTTGTVITGSTTGNILGVDPNLAVLADNGGGTLTHALNSGSAASDAGGGTVPGTDQRGVVRNSSPDIGAYETNTAPVLSTAPAVTLSISEDAGAPTGAVGSLVSELIDFAGSGGWDNVSDADTGAVTGIALTAADTSNGSWYYSIDNGSNWISLAALSNANALLLAADANTRLYFRPNSNYNGTLTTALTFRAWDRTSGSNGSTADTSSNGGSTAFSAATDTASLNVTAVNDAPTATITAVSYSATENIALTLNGTGLSVADIDAASGNIEAVLSVTEGILSAAAGTTGVIISNAGTTSITLSGTVSQINNLLAGSLGGTVAYVATSDTPSASTTLTLNVSDLANTGSGGTLTASDSAIINITALNDDPYTSIALPTDISVTEDTPSNVDLSAINFADPDAAGSSLTVTLDTSAGGSLSAASGGGVTVSGSNSSSLTLVGTLADLNTFFNSANNIQYLNPVTNLSGNNADTITIKINDGGNTGSGGGADVTLGAVNVDISAVNDAPVNSIPAAQATAKNTTLILSSGSGRALHISDVDAGAGNVQVSLVATNGKLTLSTTTGLSFSLGDGNDDASMTFTGTIAAINTALDGMSFSPTTNFEGAASIAITTSDLGNNGSGGAITDNDTLVIQVGAVSFQQGDSNGYSGTADTYVSATSPNSVYGNNTTVQVDESGGLLDIFNLFSNATVFGLLKFDNLFGPGATQIPLGSTITSASLSIYVTATDSDFLLSFDANKVQAWEMQSPWSEASNYNDAASVYIPPSTMLAEFSARTSGAITISNATLVNSLNNWAQNPSSNYGWGFFSNGADNWAFASSENGNASYRPKLLVNYTPPQAAVVTPGAGSASFTENSAAVAVAPGLTLSDADSSTLTGATIQISGNYANGQDALQFSDQNGITGSWNATTGTMTLSGNASVANYQSALRSITYANSSENPLTSTRTINFSVSDAYVSSAGASRTLNVTAVNDLPTSANGSVVTNEDTTYTFGLGNFSYSDAEGSALAGIKIASLETAGALKLNGIDVTLNQIISSADITAGNLTFTPAANANGSSYASFSFKVNDGTADSASSNSMTVNVTAVADAPINTVPGAQSVNEDSSLALPGVSVNDPDGDLSIVQLSVSHGSLTVTLQAGASISAGASGSATLTLSGTQSGINNTLATLGYQGDPDWHGIDSLVMLTTDSLSATDSDSVSITVNAVNDAPAGSDATLTLLEDSTYAFTTANFGFSDINDSPANTLLAVKITTLPASGLLKLNGLNVNAGDFVSAADIGTGLLTYTPVVDGNGTGFDSLGFQLQDNGGTANGGSDLDAVTRTLTFDVSEINDAPTGNNNTVTTSEDMDYVFSGADFGFADASDSPADTLLAVHIATLPGAGALKLNGVAVTAGQSISAIDISANRLTFSPAANANGNGYASFTFRVQDDGGTANGGIDLALASNTISIDVTAVNDEQLLATNTGLTVAEGSSGNLVSNLMLQTTDIDNSNSQLVYSLTAAPLNGTLKRSGVALGNGDSFSQADIDSGLISYDHDGSESLSDSFDFSVDDGAGTSVSSTFSLTITPVNDSPVVAINTGTSVWEGSTGNTLSNTMLNEADPDDSGSGLSYFITSTVSNGTLYRSGLALANGDSFTQADIDSGFITYTHNGSQTANDSFDFVLADGAEDGSTTVSGTFSITVNNVNDAPQGADITLTVSEDNAHTFGAADFGFSDINDSPVNGLLAVTITTLPSAGTLLLNSVAVNPGDIINLIDITAGNLTWTPALNANGSAYASFSFQVQDNGGTSHGGIDLDTTPNTITFDVAAVNDSPLATNLNSAESFVEDIALDLGDIVVSDPDSTVTVTLTLSDAAAGGLNTATSGLVTSTFVAGVWTASGAVTDVNALLAALSFTPAQDYDNHFSIATSVDDGVNPAITGLKNFTATPVNDAPHVATNNVATVAEGGSLTLATALLDAADVDDNGTGLSWSVDTSPVNGRLELSTNPGVAITGFTQDDLLNGRVVYVHDASQTTTDHFDFTLADGGEDGAPGESGAFTINIANVNDAPDGSDKTISLIEDQSYTFTVSDFGFSDNNDTPANTLLAVKISALPVAGSLTLNGNAVNAGDIISLPDINAGLLRFSPVANAFGTAYGSVSFQVQDDGGTANGGIDLDPVANVITFDVIQANDAPDGTDTTITVAEDGSHLFTTTDFGFSDSNDVPTDTLLAVHVTTLPGAGVLRLDGAAVTAGDVISVVDITAGKLVFTPDADQNGSGYASFSFRVQDDGGAANGGIDLDPVANTIGFDVSPVNDAPQLTAPLNIPVTEDVASMLSGISISDSDATTSIVSLTFSVPAGALSAITAGGVTVSGGGSSLTLSGNQTDINLFLGSGLVSYTTAANANGSVQLDLTISDLGNSGSGGVLTSATSVSLDIIAVNDLPTLSVNAGLTLDEADSALITPSILSVSDIEQSAAQLKFTLQQLPAYGELTLNGTTLGVSDQFTQDDLHNNRVRYVHDGSEHHSDLLQLTYSDGVDASIAMSFSITITPLNTHAPVISSDGGGASATVSVDENTTFVTTVSASDIDLPSASLVYSIIGGADSSFFSLDPASGALAFNTAPDRETPQDADGNHSYQVIVQVSDGALTDNQTLLITVEDVNEFAVTVPVDSNAALNRISENASIGSAVGIDVAAADADDTQNSVSYTLDDDAGGLFQIDPVTGLVSVAGAIDFESASSHIITVCAASADGSSATNTFTIDILNINDNAPQPAMPAVVTVAEDIGNALIADINESTTGNDLDRDGDALSYSLISGNEAGIFSIDPSSGEIRIVNASVMDFETAPSYLLEVSTSDGIHITTAQLLIQLTNTNEAPVNHLPVGIASDEDIVIHFNGSNSLSVSDPDSQNQEVEVSLTVSHGTLTLADQHSLTALTGTTHVENLILRGSIVAINTALQTLTFTPTHDFNGEATLTVLANDLGHSGNGSAMSDSDQVTLTLRPVNDDPVLLTPDTPLRLLPGEVLSFSTSLGPLMQAIDVDPADARMQVTLQTDQGLLEVTDPALLFSVQGNGSDKVTITGSLSQINSALRALRMAPTIGFYGEMWIDVTMVDFGSSTTDTIRSFSTSLRVEVTAPVIASEPLLLAPANNSDTADNTEQRQLTRVNSGALQSAGLVDLGKINNAVARLQLHRDDATSREDLSAILERLLDKGSVGTSAHLSNLDAIEKMRALLNALNSQSSLQLSHTIDPLYGSGAFDMLPEMPLGESEHLTLNVMESAGITLTIGSIVWLVRGGGLLSSLLLSYPAWRNVDPLPVLLHAEGKNEASQPPEKRKRRPNAVDRLLPVINSRWSLQ